MMDTLTTEHATLAAMIAIVVALVEIIKVLVARLRTGRSVLTTEEHQALMLHLKFDADGSPIWYVPRSWANVQKEIVNVCREISQHQEMIAKTLERLERNCNNHLRQPSS